MKMRITLELEEEETEQALAFVRGLLGGIRPPVTSKVETKPKAVEESEPSGNLEPVVEQHEPHHDCFENVEFDVIEDEDGIYTVVHCEICGHDVSEEYHEVDGDDDGDDDYFDPMRELMDSGGDEDDTSTE